jgi:hypothetical protein
VILISDHMSMECLPLRGAKRREQLATIFDERCSQMVG